MQNAKALAKDVPVAIMGQAQATHYREYVHTRLVKESEKETGTNPTCQPKKGTQNWVL